jgi:hypothetical protein
MSSSGGEKVRPYNGLSRMPGIWTGERQNAFRSCSNAFDTPHETKRQPDVFCRRNGRKARISMAGNW